MAVKPFQTELAQPLGQFLEEAFGFIAKLEADNEVVGLALIHHLPATPFLHDPLDSEVKCVVKVDIRKHGRDNPALWCACGRVNHCPVLLQYTRSQPFAYQADEVTVSNSFL